MKIKEFKMLALGTIIICFSACTQSNNTVDEEIKSLTKSNTISYTQDQVHDKFYIRNDSIFLNGTTEGTTYTGTIKILGNYKTVGENGEIIEKQGITAIFNIINGAFTGEQLYSSEETREEPKYFFKAEIVPGMDMQSGIDYVEVNEDEDSDFGHRTPFGNRYYKIINYKNFEPIKISIFWSNGNLWNDGIYSFNKSWYAEADALPLYQKKLFYQNDKKDVNFYHYNGKLAYKGPINDAGKISSKGAFYDITGNKTDSATFVMPTGFSNSNITASKLPFDMPDEAYKCYRNFFSNSYRRTNNDNPLDSVAVDSVVIE